MSTAQNEKLRSAISCNRPEWVLQAIGQGADVNHIHGEVTPIYSASGRNCVEIIQLLITYGADVNLGSDSGSTSLHRASRSGFLEIAQLLVENGADINALDESNRTPLYNASMFDKREIVQLLVNYGADVNIGDVEGITPLHRASVKGSVEIVCLLIENGANVDAKSVSNQTPWNLACSKGQANKLSEVFRTVRQQGSRTQTQPNFSIPNRQNSYAAETALSTRLNSLRTSSPSTRPECNICTENEADHAIIPCGHVFCLGCINRTRREFHNCPTCRRPIQTNLKLFF